MGAKEREKMMRLKCYYDFCIFDGGGGSYLSIKITERKPF